MDPDGSPRFVADTAMRLPCAQLYTTLSALSVCSMRTAVHGPSALSIGLAHAHSGRTRGRQHVSHKHEDGLLRRDADALADHVHKLAHGEICRYQVPASWWREGDGNTTSWVHFCTCVAPVLARPPWRSWQGVRAECSWG